MYLVSARYTRHTAVAPVAAAAACQPNVCHALGFPFVAAAAAAHKCICNKLLTLASRCQRQLRRWHRVASRRTNSASKRVETLLCAVAVCASDTKRNFEILFLCAYLNSFVFRVRVCVLIKNFCCKLLLNFLVSTAGSINAQVTLANFQDL